MEARRRRPELLADDPDHLERVPVTATDGAADADHVACEPETVDGWKRSPPADVVDRLGATDVAVRFGFGFLVGDALTAPPTAS